MKLEQISIKNLLPIEPYLRNRFYAVSEMRSDLKNLTPIAVIKNKNKFIVGDGHHRTIAYLLEEEKEIPAKIIETNKEMRDAQEGAFNACLTLWGFRAKYNFTFKTQCQRAGIRTFQDYIDSHYGGHQ